jgi:hypothetical protein
MNKRINISLSDKLHEKALSWANTKGLSFSGLLTELLEKEIFQYSQHSNTSTINEPKTAYHTKINPSLLEKIQNLPAYQLQHLELYTDFLLSTQKNNMLQRLGPGLLAGHIRISKDFDDPIEDFNEYMFPPKK